MELRPVVIVPAAGMGSRFGHLEVPKALLRFRWQGHEDTMLGHQLREMRRALPDVEVHIGAQAGVVSMKFDQFDAAIHGVPAPIYGHGQAATVSWLAAEVACPRPLLVSNCDVWMRAEGWTALCGLEAGVATFPAPTMANAPYSYVDQCVLGTRFAERVPISTRAMAGFWSVPSSDAVIGAYRRTHWMGERYFSGMLSEIAAHWTETDAPGFTDFGTPAAMEMAGVVLT